MRFIRRYGLFGLAAAAMVLIVVVPLAIVMVQGFIVGATGRVALHPGPRDARGHALALLGRAAQHPGHRTGRDGYCVRRGHADGVAVRAHQSAGQRAAGEACDHPDLHSAVRRAPSRGSCWRRRASAPSTIPFARSMGLRAVQRLHAHRHRLGDRHLPGAVRDDDRGRRAAQHGPEPGGGGAGLRAEPLAHGDHGHAAARWRPRSCPARCWPSSSPSACSERPW